MSSVQLRRAPDETRPNGGRLVNRSQTLADRRAAECATRTTIDEWTLASSASPDELQEFDDAMTDLHDAVSVANHEIYGDPLPEHLPGGAVQLRERREGRKAAKAPAVTGTAVQKKEAGHGALKVDHKLQDRDKQSVSLGLGSGGIDAKVEREVLKKEIGFRLFPTRGIFVGDDPHGELVPRLTPALWLSAKLTVRVGTSGKAGADKRAAKAGITIDGVLAIKGGWKQFNVFISGTLRGEAAAQLVFRGERKEPSYGSVAGDLVAFLSGGGLVDAKLAPAAAGTKQSPKAQGKVELSSRPYKLLRFTIAEVGEVGVKGLDVELGEDAAALLEWFKGALGVHDGEPAPEQTAPSSDAPACYEPADGITGPAGPTSSTGSAEGGELRHRRPTPPGRRSRDPQRRKLLATPARHRAPRA